MFERGDSFSRILKIYVSDKAEIFFGFFFQKRREVSAAAPTFCVQMPKSQRNIDG